MSPGDVVILGVDYIDKGLRAGYVGVIHEAHKDIGLVEVEFEIARLPQKKAVYLITSVKIKDLILMGTNDDQPTI